MQQIKLTIEYDVSELLGIVKYEPPIPACLSGKVKGSFPGFLRKTDEERIQNLGELVSQLRGLKLYISEKIDGCSATYYKRNGIFGVCSRNLELLETEGNTLWELAKKYNLAELIPDGFALQGEAAGSGIQNNPLKLTVQDLFIFNVYNIDSQKYLDFSEFVNFCKERKLTTVPILNANYAMTNTVEELLSMANGMSARNPTILREGLVFRPLVEQLAEINGSQQRLSFKVISNEYLLKYE